MNIQQFQYVVAVAELRHFEQAADKCFIGQSTLSTMIGRFEKEMGIKIFDRRTKPVSITREGEEVIRHLKIVLKEISSLENRIQEIKGEIMGTLRIGIIPTVAPHLLPLFLSAFAKSFSKIHIVVQEMTTPNIQKALKDGSLDVGIVALPLEDPYLQEYPLYKEPFLLFDHFSQVVRSSRATVDRIDPAHFLLLEEGHCFRNQVEKICNMFIGKQHVTLNFEFKAGSLDSLIRFTKAYKGTTLLPYLSTLDLERGDRTRLIPFKDPVPVRNIGLVVHEHFVKNRILHALEGMISDAVMPLMAKAGEAWLVKP